MDLDTLWAAIDDQRLRTVAMLESLTPQDWQQPSLCAGWTVRDVAAHLTLQQLTLGQALRSAARHPGGMNRVIRESARAQAALPVDRLVAEIGGMVGSRRHNVGVTPSETLVDLVVHGQDIAVPLGRELVVPVPTAAEAAARVWWSRTTLRGRATASVFRAVDCGRYRFTATDAAWSAGDGPEVRGPVLAILLVLTGRPAGLDRLSGDGLAALTREFALAQTR